jgi:hypothetical protein
LRTNADIWDEAGTTILKLLPLSDGKVSLIIEDVDADVDDPTSFCSIDVNLDELRMALEKIGWDDSSEKFVRKDPEPDQNMP